MTSTTKPIPFEEFSSNLSSFFEQVIREHEAIVVENEQGECAVLKPVRARKIRRRKKTEADYEAFRASAGGWKDVDVDQFLKDNYESRSISTRPPVEL